MTFEVVGMSAADQTAWQHSLGVPVEDAISVSSAEILALHSDGKQLVAAPGAGKIVQIRWATISYTFGTVEYTGGGGILFRYGVDGTSSLFIGISNQPFLGSVNQYMIASPDQGVFTSYENQPIVMVSHNNGGDSAFLDGDGTAIINIAYKIVDAV